MFKSVQWKIVFIYSLLILFAMQFFAVFLSQSLESYYVNNYSKNLESQGLLLANFLERYLVAGDEGEAVDNLVREYSRYAGTTDIIVLDAFGRVISSSRMDDELRGQRIIQDEITRALTGSRSDAVRMDPEAQEQIKYLALPIRSGEKILGVVYLIGSLGPIYSTLREVQYILLTGALLVIGVTVLLGFILAKTITGPIKEVTSKAAQIAHGDFRQRIKIRSEDEIGRLGEMFNYLSQQLDGTLQEISSEKGKVEAILNHMTDGIVALNRDGQLLHLNPAARKLLHIHENEEPSADALSFLVAHVDLAQLLNTGRQESRELVLEPHKSRIMVNYVPFHTPKTPGAAGYFSGVLIILHDVTKERELVRIQQEFVANVSHELRTPLTTLKSYTETLLGGAMYQPETCLSFLSTMEKETERMVRLVKDLLVLSQFDYHQVTLRMKKQSLDELILEVIHELHVKWEDKERIVTMDFFNQPVTCRFDRDKMKQVFINIVQNAFKYTLPGGHIDISLKDTAEAVAVCIADDGIGIPKEDKERVFDRFYRVDKTRSRDFGGTGLGLAIAREIVDAHGGVISIISDSGSGTKITISLPKQLTTEGNATKWESA